MSLDDIRSTAKLAGGIIRRHKIDRSNPFDSMVMGPLKGVVAANEIGKNVAQGAASIPRDANRFVETQFDAIGAGDAFDLLDAREANKRVFLHPIETYRRTRQARREAEESAGERAGHLLGRQGILPTLAKILHQSTRNFTPVGAAANVGGALYLTRQQIEQARDEALQRAQRNPLERP